MTLTDPQYKTLLDAIEIAERLRKEPDTLISSYASKAAYNLTKLFDTCADVQSELEATAPF